MMASPDETEPTANKPHSGPEPAPRSPINRHAFSAHDVVHELWSHLGLPSHCLASLNLPGPSGPTLPSSFKIGLLAQSSIALAALSAALLHATRNHTPAVPRVHVAPDRAVAEFMSERLYELDGKPAGSPWGVLGGLHRTVDGYVRVHDGFANLAHGTLDLLGLPPAATREDVAAKIAQWRSVDLENAATVEGKLAIYALRTPQEWDALPQSAAEPSVPVNLTQLVPGPPKPLAPSHSRRCLRGLRVLELSRVIAAPLAGRTLAAHGADVLWVTSPNLPDMPAVDRDLARGKRTAQLDLDSAADKARLLELARTCDVVIQGYRPGSLASRGFSPEELARVSPGIVYASLSAFARDGPWAGRRGFDSLVQTCSGLNVTEAQHAGQGEAARALPCQALDHGAGYVLAAGILAAVRRRGEEGGSWRVEVSLAGVMKYLRSLGQYPGGSGFGGPGFEVPAEAFEVRETGFGRMRAVRHSAAVEGCEVGWEVMPKPLGSDRPEWVQ